MLQRSGHGPTSTARAEFVRSVVARWPQVVARLVAQDRHAARDRGRDGGRRPGPERRWPQSRRRGRLGTPAEVVIRLLILKHLFNWSYDDLEQEVRANLVYRMFTRIDAGEVPDAKTILKIARALGPEVIERLPRNVIELAKGGGVTPGRRFRVDTTVVETTVHYPTDSTLLQDGVRVLTRTMQRASTALGDRAGWIRNRLRSVTRRVLIIGYE